jgi:dienelactone hydrolase
MHPASRREDDPMVEVLLFHHALGLTDGVRAFGDALRDAGHRVTLPDLFDGRSFISVEEGVAHAHELGFETILARGAEVGERLPADIVYAGFSLGAMPAQALAQQRAGARGALLYHSAVPLGEFGDRWPDRVRLQMHVMIDDPFDDLPVMQELAGSPAAELFTYDGDGHLFTDPSLPGHDPVAARLVMVRSLDFLAQLA